MSLLEETSFLYIPPPLDDIPDTEEDKPVDGVQLVCIPSQKLFESNIPLSQHTVGTQQLPYLIFGAGTFANQYNQDDFLYSDGPLRVVRLALR